jgi:phosphatidylserine/phosphatidylglycerophosphate/cardiolipin synthase-like enzyme
MATTESTLPLALFADAGVRLVADAEYMDELLALVRAAQQRVWCSVFLIDVTSAYDEPQRVMLVLRELVAARWRGCDVRLVIGGSRTDVSLAVHAAAALRVARRLGVPARWSTEHDRRGSHVKCVLADDRVLMGSHNWTPGAFTTEVEDSLLIHSRDLAAPIAELLIAQWLRAKEQS